ncbi:MAG: adenylosuccinate synthase [Oligoflexus sp.]
MGNVTVLVGAQWGDEGKGKWIDILAHDVEIVARYQGGNNAGHTLYVNGQKVVLHQIPSGIFQPDKVSALSAGVVINPSELVQEINKVKPFVELVPERLWISARAHVITPWHIHLDGKREQEADQPIGTTKRGIGPTYAEKANRSGLRIGDFVDEKRRQAWVEGMRRSFPGFNDSLESQADAWQAFHQAAAVLRPFVRDAELSLRQAIKKGKKVLMEGAQGALLDINHGTYPFVTSSETAAGGAFASVGFAPRFIDKIYGVAKAYTTRVGEGPFPTELHDDYGRQLAEKGKEFGATTGRPRRCGWLDAVALRYSLDVNGFDGIILNKMDILTGFDEIKLAVAYRHPELGELKDFPWSLDILKDCEPVYQSFAGWHEEIPNSGRIADLPEAARRYIEGVEAAIEAPVTMVGTGVNRSDALFR